MTDLEACQGDSSIERNCRVVVRVAVAIVVLLANTATGQESQAIPKSIPATPFTPSALLDSVCEALRIIEDPAERFETITVAVMSLNHAHGKSTAPVVALFGGTVDELSDERLRSLSHEALMAHAPEVAWKLAPRIREPREKQLFLTRIVARCVYNHPDVARRILHDIELAEARAPALALIAAYGKPDFDEAKALTAEAVELGPPQKFLPFTYPNTAFAHSMSRFAAQRPDEVCEFLTTQLPPENSISVFCTVGSRVLHRDKNRDAAEKIFRRAVAQLPGVKDPHIQVISLIRAGLNELDPEQSIELYDKYNPNPSDYPFAVGSLIHLGMPVLIERAEAVARRQGKSPEEILPEIIARAATEKRETVFAWLTERPADQLRENCLPSVVEAWRHYMIANLREESRSWLEPLWNVAVVVRDDELKWRAFHELLKLSRALDVAPPQPHFDEARRLFESLNVAETFTLRDWSGEITLGLLTPDGERRWIATFLPEVLEDASLTPEHLAESRGRLAGLARIVARSSLPVDEKRALFRRLISYSGDNRSVKAHLAQPLAEFNCRGALELLWSTLPADRGASGKKVYLDWIPPPSDAHDAIAWLRHDEYSRESPDNAVAAALWEFLPEAPAGDRDALLAEMSATLIRLGRHEEAHGVARIINSPSERAIALAKIAGAAGGK